jgi:hypothetical protein
MWMTTQMVCQPVSPSARQREESARQFCGRRHRPHGSANGTLRALQSSPSLTSFLTHALQSRQVDPPCLCPEPVNCFAS